MCVQVTHYVEMVPNDLPRLKFKARGSFFIIIFNSFFVDRGDMKTKIDSLKKVIQLILNGEKMSPSMLMTVIRFVMPLQVGHGMLQSRCRLALLICILGPTECLKIMK